ncbi:diguanylate cyclase [Bradyrhizobium sp. RD5-C2]|uniref:diguanylate cyclase n=1 Tax=Bradyrhizobium sp. RD5-C2 TaxID=244562 RepID=UPI001CC3A22B|nr:diguanylate cyclase [Bradyrhizobium sp. RD5-C2]GIQ74442.1 diguanylate cyclase [Bradyrhizobium sp. RD5-C2]
MDPIDLPNSPAKLPKLFSPTAIVAAVVTAMSIFVLGLLIWKAVEARTMALAQGERDIRNLTHSLAEHASHSVQAIDVSMNAMVDLLKYQKPRVDRFNAALRKTADALPQIREIGVIDPDGNRIYSSAAELPAHNNADRSYFIGHRDSPDATLHISEPLQSRLTGHPTIVLSRRVTREDGSFGGVLFATIESSYFDNFYQAFEFGPHAGITLLRLDGIVLAHWPAGKWNKEVSAAFKAQIEQERTGYTKTTSPFDGRVKYLGFERASQYPIVITVALPEAQVLAAWHEDLRNDLFVAVILMGSVILFAILLGKEFAKRTRVARMLREREARYRLLADNIADVVILLDRDGRFLFVSQSVETILGRKPDDLIGKSCFEFVHPDHLADVARATSELTNWTTTKTVDFKTFRADGTEIWVEINFKLAGLAEDHQAIEVVGVLRDVTERRKMEDELNALNMRLSELATTDGLTALANRRSFDSALPREFRDRDQISLIMLDIDHFKGFNDTLGHQAGDECLKRVARVIADATINTTALAARYGGEEFAIILPGIGEQDALKVAEAMRLTVRSLAIANPPTRRGVVSISLGIASRSAATANESELLGQADLALYEAKRSGRDRTVLASSLAGDNHSAGRKQYA